MSQLTDAQHAYAMQRDEALFAGPRELRRIFRRACKRAANGSYVAKARVKALRDEYAARGEEPPRV